MKESERFQLDLEGICRAYKGTYDLKDISEADKQELAISYLNTKNGQLNFLEEGLYDNMDIFSAKLTAVIECKEEAKENLISFMLKEIWNCIEYNGKCEEIWEQERARCGYGNNADYLCDDEPDFESEEND